jgi:hypothetical protein
MRYQERLHAHGGRRVDDLAQLRMHGNFEMCFFASFGLPLIDGQYVIVDMLQVHPHDIRPTLAGVKQECESKPRFGPNRMRDLKAGDLIFGPCLVAL